VIVVISAKYLRSEYCMYELFMIYQNCCKKAEDFHRRIIPIILPDAGLSGSTAAWLKPADEWDKQRKEIEATLAKNPDVLGERGYKKYRLICEFSRNTFDMLDYLQDQLQSRDYNRQMEEGFPELCEQILAG
jgi:internalin A